VPSDRCGNILDFIEAIATLIAWRRDVGPLVLFEEVAIHALHSLPEFFRRLVHAMSLIVHLATTSRADRSP
jgi:hypothetical protein